MPKYDVAVIGAGIGGLSIAALLSQAGKNVLLTDPLGRAGGAVAAFDTDGFRFSAGPSAVYGLEQGGSLRSLCTSIGIEGITSLPPARYQVVMPGRRITVAPSREESLDELRREFPAEIDRLSALHRDAEKISLRCASSRLSSYLAGRRTAASFLSAYALSRELSAFFTVRTSYFFGRGLDALPLKSLVRMLCAAPVAFPGGYTRLAIQLASAISGRNGTVLWNEPWPELLSRGRKASGIRTSQGALESASVLVNADGMPSETTLFLGLRSNVIPVRMEHTVLCLPDYRSPKDFFSFAVDPREESAPEGMCSLTATFPASDGSATDQDRLITRLQTIIPFLRDFIVSITSLDGAARCFRLPDGIAPGRKGERSGQPAPFRGRLKNVLIMPDSSRLMLSSVQAAVHTASRLI